MQTSLSRRQRRRRTGAGRRSPGGGLGRRVAIAIPLILFIGFLTVGLGAFVGVVSAYAFYSSNLPDPKGLLDNLAFDQQTVVYDRTGKIELARLGETKRLLVTYDEIPPEMLDATTAVEDHTFWENAGFDPVAIVSAGLDTLRGASRGASTITQQLVRARLLPAEAFAGSVYDRKMREIIQSIRLTQEFPGEVGKQQIITDYLNQNFYGNQSYGVAAAAQSYFGKPLSKLDLAQVAILAAIPKSPTAYDLRKNAVDQCAVTVAAGKDCPTDKLQMIVPPDTEVVQRRNQILDLMKTRSVLSGSRHTLADYDAAKEEPVVLAEQGVPQWRAPQFVWQVRHDLGAILCGEANADTCEQVDTGGFTLTTSLNWPMQQDAEKWLKVFVICAHAPSPGTCAKVNGLSSQTWNSVKSFVVRLGQNNIHNGALAAIDYRTGQVLAYVGSADYYSKKATKKFQPQFDVLSDGWRQVGSAFKPVSYVTGLEDHTITAATQLMDVVTDFGGGYTPTDADNLERGPLRMREAVQFSLNIPAEKAAAMIGPDRVFQNARNMGLHFQKDHNVAGISIAIGTLEVHPIDLLGAYGAIANGGVLMPRTTILTVVDKDGHQLWPLSQGKPTGKRVVSVQAAYIMSDVLKGNTTPSVNPFWARAMITDGGRRRPAALKTGTTNDTKDLTSMGYVAPPSDATSPGIAVGAWMGNSDNSQTGNVFSLEGPTPMWQHFLTDITKGTPITDFKRPPGIVTATVDAYSGFLPGPGTTRTISEIFIDGTVPSREDNLHKSVAIDAATGLLWADGCTGPKVTKSFLDFSQVDQAFPRWQKYDLGWARRAAHGSGVSGGPKGTRTSYFFGSGFFPFGRTWGGSFAPTQVCAPVPVIPPPCGPIGFPGGPPGLEPSPTPCPTPPPGSSPTPTPSPTGKGHP